MVSVYSMLHLTLEKTIYSWLHANIMFLLCSAVFDQLDLVTYEEVVKLPSFKRKTLVLLGKYFNTVKLFVFVCLVGGYYSDFLLQRFGL